MASLAEKADLAVETIRSLSKASSCLTTKGSKELAIGCEAAKAVMDKHFRAVVEEFQGSVILTSKSCDGTPINCVERTQRVQASGKKGDHIREADS